MRYKIGKIESAAVNFRPSKRDFVFVLKISGHNGYDWTSETFEWVFAETQQGADIISEVLSNFGVKDIADIAGKPCFIRTWFCSDAGHEDHVRRSVSPFLGFSREGVPVYKWIDELPKVR